MKTGYLKLYILLLAAASMLPSTAFSANKIRLEVIPDYSYGDVQIWNFTNSTSFGPSNVVEDTSATNSCGMRIKALPASGYVFVIWEDVMGSIIPAGWFTSNTVTFTADGGEYWMEAKFKATPGIITVNSSEPTYGTVSLTNNTSGYFDNTSPVQDSDVDVNDSITLSAVLAGPLYDFLGWRMDGGAGYVSTAPNYTDTADGANHNYEAVFELAGKLVTVSVYSGEDYSGVGSGQVVITNSTTGQADGPGSLVSVVVDGDNGIIVTPNPSLGDRFFMWLGDGININNERQNPLTFTALDQSYDIIALFSDGDLDGDGMSDTNELYYDLDPTDPSDADGDADLDGLSNLEELQGPYVPGEPTNPQVHDSDGDKMGDGWESYHGLDPNDATGANGASGNPDNDWRFDTVTGLPSIPYDNEDEYTYFVEQNGSANIAAGQFLTAMLLAVDPYDSDTDDDYLPDGWEVTYELDPIDDGSISVDNGAVGNPDADENYVVTANNADSGKPTNPFTNLEEYERYSVYGVGSTHPGNPDSDGDGLPDGWEHDFSITAGYPNPDPLDSTGDNGPNGNPDNDYTFDPTTGKRSGTPFSNIMEFQASATETIRGATTHPNEEDIDGDGLPDHWEISFQYDPWYYCTPGSEGSDAADNPDKDYMADDGVNTHNSVYSANRFDPRTAWKNSAGWSKFGYLWQHPGAPVDSPNTRYFSNIDEYHGLATTPSSYGTVRSTHPRNIDTDGDGIQDGWEHYVGLNPELPEGTIDGSDDGDDDALPNLAEFQCAAIGNLADTAWQNKIWPTDPNDPDTDNDQIYDGLEKDFMYSGGGGAWNNHCYDGGGLNPTSVDTDGDHIPDAWERKFPSTTGSAIDRNGMDGTIDDAYATNASSYTETLENDYDDDGLENYQEYLTASIYHWQYLDWAAGAGFGGYDPVDFFTGTPYEWDWHHYADADINQLLAATPFTFIRGDFIPPDSLWYSSTDPTDWDSDWDNIDDFYEAYHGLNPLFGTKDVYLSKIYHVNVLASLYGLTLDVRINPYINGSQYLDSDQDGLPNSEEGLQANELDPQYYHTDPSPMWITDPSYELSWPNLYYWQGTVPWFWYDGYMPLSGPIIPAVSYVFSFDANEGYDTDNDNLPDRAELVDSSSPGSTDPIDNEDPIKRRALYLNGNAAARTRCGYYHDNNPLENFTVEAWVRPENPASGTDQVIIERPLEVYIGNPMEISPGIRLNFRLAIDGNGYPYIEYTGAGKEAVFVDAKADGAPLLANEWAHLAGTYNGTDGQLNLYVDGKLIKSTPSFERPANGWFQGDPGWVWKEPIVVGARENNPEGWVSGTTILIGQLAGYYPGGNVTREDPDLDRFFRGWVDEIRIWDGAQNQASIRANMTKRMKRSEVQASITARADSTNSLAPELMYLYTFDDLPDPDYTAAPYSPEGFSMLNGRPNDGSYPGIPWWRTAPDRSQVYNDYFYIPWIENTAAHVPLSPPADTLHWDWPYVASNIVEGVMVITSNEYPNTSNPYGFSYIHGITFGSEDHPDFINSAHVLFNPRENALYNDLLPLRYAEADEDVEMWDGGGAGTNVTFDTDNDGLPDAWETANGLDPLDSSGDNGADGDPDNDGLGNLAEYQAGTDPIAADSDNDGVDDDEEDSDGDGLSNGDEANLYGTNPGNSDSDDDGFSDGSEINGSSVCGNVQVSSPLYSRSPVVPRSMVLSGPAVTIPEPTTWNPETGLLEQRFALLERWAVGCYVKTEGAETGSLLNRQTRSGQTHFELRLDANVPSIRFTTPEGAAYSVAASTAIPTNQWVSLMGWWQPSIDSLSLYVNGLGVTSVVVTADCATGSGTITIGQGIQGNIDDIYIAPTTWSQFALSDYVLVLDVSGSMWGQPIADLQSAAKEAIDRMPVGGEMAIITFSSGASLAQDFTSDRDTLKSVVDGLTAGGGTDYTEPLELLIETFERRGSQRTRMAIFISDGMPWESPTDSLIQDVADANITVNTIGFGYAIQGYSTDLERIADGTGGTYYPAPTSDQLQNILGGLVSLEAACFYPFDDGGSYAEDLFHQLDWDYAISSATFSSNDYNTKESTFNWMFTDDIESIPTWWSSFWFGEAYVDPDGDSDSDGLNNLNEYRVGLNPLVPDSDGDGTSDFYEDYDGDGVANGNEEDLYDTNPAEADTDDDGTDDGTELTNGTYPTKSLNPYVARALNFSGSTGAENTVVVSDMIDGEYTGRLNLPVWTVELTVMPSNLPGPGAVWPLVKRTVNSNFTGRVNYEIGITNNLPYVRFDEEAGGVAIRVIGGTAVSTNTWTHLAGRFSDGVLSLFVDGELVGSRDVLSQCARGYGDLTIGCSGFAGRILGVRIWKVAQSDEQIRKFMQETLFFGSVSGMAGYLEVSGNGYLKETSVTLAGSGQYIDDLTDEWTLEAWVRTTGSGTVIARRNTSAATADDFNYYLGVGANGALLGRFAIGYDVYIQDTNLVWVYDHTSYDYTVNNIVGDITVNDGQWHHVAYVRDDQSCFLYIDGILDAKQDNLLVPGVADGQMIFNVWVHSLDGSVVMGEHMSGNLDEIRIWNRGLDNTEIRTVNAANLAGTENGLISYFNFDYQLGDLADERSYLRDPEFEYGVYVGDARLVTGVKDGPPITYDPLLTFQRVALVGYYSANDGGDTLEDYMHKMGTEPFGFEKYAGVLGTNVSFVTLTTSEIPYTTDSDSDGLPDWWESMNGLNPGLAEGNDGAWGDPDNDGLNNWAEYMTWVDGSGANLDPQNCDTDGDGFGDYDDRSGPGARTWGELYDDGDGIPDAWEALYPGPAPGTGKRGLDPAYYDADLDPDKDGWSNYAEYMGSYMSTAGLVRSSNPLDPSSYPQPLVTIRARYFGVLGDSIESVSGTPTVHLDFYSSPARDGFPVATLDMLSSTNSTRTFTSGHLVEGVNYVFAYIDVDGDGQWDAASEPAGIAQFDMGWGDVNDVEVGLTDDLPGYPRFNWTAVTGAECYEIKFKQGSTELFTRTIPNSTRNYMHEGDYLLAGRYGLGAGTYNCQIYTNASVYGKEYLDFYDVKIMIVDSVTLSTPTNVTPHDTTYSYARNEAEWTFDRKATAYTLEIATNSGGSPIAAVTTNPPYRDKSGNYCADLPFYAQDTYGPGMVWTNRRYWMRIQASTPSASSGYSSWSAFNLNLKTPANGGKSMISGDVYYFGKVSHAHTNSPRYLAGETNLNIIVQSFMSQGFSGEPDAQVQVTYVCNTNSPSADKGDYTLLGLHNGEHYVRAFIDVNGNRKLDTFEPYGFAKDITSGTDYEPRKIDLSGSGSISATGVRIVIRDRDTDDDQLPDGWEWMYFGNLSYGANDTAPGNTNLTVLRTYEIEPADLDPNRDDYDYDGLTDFFEITYSDYIAGTPLDVNHYDPYDPVSNPSGTDLNPITWDTDGDGLSDGYEVDHGLNPLDPAGDADGDGIRDADEVLHVFTDPHDRIDVLRIQGVALEKTAQAGFTLQWQGQDGVNYQVQYSDDLKGWHNAPDGTFYNGGIHTYSDQSAATNDARFYRIVAW